MSAKNTLQRMRRSVAARPEPAPDSGPAPADEPKQLARELARALADELEKYRRAAAGREERPDPAQPLPEFCLRAILDAPPEEVTFADLRQLSCFNPELAQAHWDKVKEQAGQDLASGWLAARSLEATGGSAWERACFFATRDRLRRAWAPRDDAEALLLDELAQCETLRRKWVGLLARLTDHPLAAAALERPADRDAERRFGLADALREATRMVERLHRLCHHTLRTLLAVRRPGRALFVGRAGQVNLAAGPQQNVSVK